MTTSTQSQSPRTPFDDADADIIFRSSDGIDFRLYKVIVAKASSIFRGMLSLPDAPDAPPNEPQVVELTENARILEHIFRFCCPVEHPTINSVDDVNAVLNAVRKYEMTAVMANIRRVVKHMLPKEPLRIYAVAYMWEFEDVAREAAELLLDDPQFHVPASPPPEFAALPALALYKLHIYRQECAKAVAAVLEDRDWILNGSHARALVSSGSSWASTWIWVACGTSDSVGCDLDVGIVWNAPPKRRSERQLPSCTSPACSQAPVGSELSSRHHGRCSPRQWWWTYLQSLELDLAVRPSGRTVRSHLAGARHEALRQAAECPTCMPKAYADLTLFNELLAQKIDDAIAKVKIDLPFGRRERCRDQIVNEVVRPEVAARSSI